MGRYIAEREAGEADVLIEPNLRAIGRFDFEQVEPAIIAGREAAERALPRILNVIRARLGP
jgi:predicted acylesterase/phospholipase RssA